MKHPDLKFSEPQTGIDSLDRVISDHRLIENTRPITSFTLPGLNFITLTREPKNGVPLLNIRIGLSYKIDLSSPLTTLYSVSIYTSEKSSHFKIIRETTEGKESLFQLGETIETLLDSIDHQEASDPRTPVQRIIEDNVTDRYGYDAKCPVPEYPKTLRLTLLRTLRAVDLSELDICRPFDSFEGLDLREGFQHKIIPYNPPPYKHISNLVLKDKKIEKRPWDY